MDFDNDGLTDLIVGEREGYVNFFKRLGDGTLTDEGRIQAAGADLDVGQNSAPFVYDWDNDGLLDLLVGRDSSPGGGPTLYLFINEGTVSDDEYTTGVPVVKGSSAITWSRLIPHMEDLNGDGLADLLIGEDGGHTYYLENTGTVGAPLFPSSSNITVNGSTYVWTSGNTDNTVYVNDWNEDGVLDIIQGNYVKNVWVFLGTNVGLEDYNSQVVGAGVSVDLHTNPMDSSLSYSVTSQQPVPVSVTLYGMDGRIAEQWNLGTLQGLSEHVHAVSELPAGVYSLVVQAGSEMSCRQVAVIR